MMSFIKTKICDQYELTMMVSHGFSLAHEFPFMALLGSYRNHLNHPFPFIGELVDNLFEPLLNVAPHWRHVDFMPDFYVEEFTFQVP
jgi:hypothetical protein